MKKMMFNDEQGLTNAVLAKLKWQTRRAVSNSLWEKWTVYDDFCNSVALGDIPATREYYDEQAFFFAYSPYKVGEIVAIAQSYKDAGVSYIPEEDDEFGSYNFPAEQTNGWNNKMFVRANLMPHHIRITKVRVERLQDISDEDCLAEGVVEVVKRIPTQAEQYVTKYYPSKASKEAAEKVGWGRVYDTPQLAYEALIGFVSGKGVWKENPYVFVYDFELVD